ncbi:hypothetical protein BC937DRAFT_88976 [Endogone sp. FLAS-F59071]|nr:hypothetical protein BC937DRAFT_88976 [Endogone sp. FLAS-F59071]|eukprot:RUS18264.1 hypothetical protein BC937DRAFT_88976 [Endogone sp. FLAS-F59071]
MALCATCNFTLRTICTPFVLGASVPSSSMTLTPCTICAKCISKLNQRTKGPIIIILYLFLSIRETVQKPLITG